ncbi:hypothetical protein GCM10022267_25760 [Lentzea roselyniae]|uniref:DNA (cytosine-5-)-methyltransferase n=1 Tax=Lentzea roselyniae TaxID=531940 RepID=A0ABP7AQ70_9PSEU
MNARIGGLFEGYGGLTMAVQSAIGGELAWYSEIDPGACRVLAHHHADVPNLGSVSEIDWSAVRPVDVLAAGFPCQDISHAGRRAGITGARSGLWSHVVDALRVLRPRLVVLENVSALLVRGLDRVAADLAEVRYDLRWTCIRASDVGAPHRRERWFGVAEDANCSARGERWLAAPGQAESGWARSDLGGRGRASVANPNGEGRQGTEPAWRHDLSPRGASAGTAWGPFEAAIRRWEQVLGQPAPEPTESGRTSNRVLSPRFVEWLMGLPPGWITDVPGLSRSQQLRLLGNGVVPQQGAAAITTLHAPDAHVGGWAA